MKPRIDENADPFWNPPRRVVGLWLPEREDVPEEFNSTRSNPWCRIAEHWFFHGIDGELVAQDGIDWDDAVKHAKICLMSREPGHNHKISAVGWLLSQWFDAYVPGDDEDDALAIDAED